MVEAVEVPTFLLFLSLWVEVVPRVRSSSRVLELDSSRCGSSPTQCAGPPVEVVQPSSDSLNLLDWTQFGRDVVRSQSLKYQERLET